jgi:hypothetical protein
MPEHGLGENTNSTASGAAQAPSPLVFACSAEELTQCFVWAKTQAMAYVYDGDPVGAWYEAALPGREAFCMRDVSHQAVGAHALGLHRHNLNMLHKFAANISESKDWCTYWEINRYDKPAPVDYRSDTEFWYNLPANFDVLDACYRIYTWSQDPTFITDPSFIRFYRKTVSEYVDRWDLGLDKILTRERFMNRESYDPKDPYQFCRGIPSYDERDPGRTQLGVDLLAFQAAAYRSFARILDMWGETDKSAALCERSNAVKRLIVQTFWDQENDRFYDLVSTDGQRSLGGGMLVYLLYTDALDALDYIQKAIRATVKGPPTGVEMHSHYPEVFYRYGAHKEANHAILELCDPQTKRRAYPEVSFAVIGALVTGLMGVEPLVTEGAVATLARLTDEIRWAEVRHLPFWGNVLDVRHNGGNETVLTNRAGASLDWVAKFYGRSCQLEVDGKWIETTTGIDKAGNELAWTRATVAPGRSVTVRKTASQAATQTNQPI